MAFLILNPGSSSLKFSLFAMPGERLLADGDVDWSPQRMSMVVRRPEAPETHTRLAEPSFREATRRVVAELRSLAPQGLRAIGCRVVHGGERFNRAVRVTPEVKQAIGELSELAPLHNPASVACLDALDAVLPGVPQVVVFDTAFHATLPLPARTYPIPFRWTEEWGLRRFGFHGLSHSYCAVRAAELLGRGDLRLVIAHLGQGASLSAVAGGVCIDTTMGFTPLDGLMMGSRSGSVDPGLLIHVLRKHGLNADQLDHALNQESGLAGVSGVSSDLREVLAAAASNPRARLAVAIYVHRIVQLIGAMTASLGGLDALVFTAGVGEHSREIRSQVCARLGHLGLRLDEAAQTTREPDVDVALADSPARILILRTREDLTILRETCKLVST
jgi:acetate kinase